MKTIDTRLRKLEDRFGTGDGKPPILVVIKTVGMGLALSEDRCLQILEGCGHLSADPIRVVCRRNP